MPPLIWLFFEKVAFKLLNKNEMPDLKTDMELEGESSKRGKRSKE